MMPSIILFAIIMRIKKNRVSYQFVQCSAVFHCSHKNTINRLLFFILSVNFQKTMNYYSYFIECCMQMDDRKGIMSSFMKFLSFQRIYIRFNLMELLTINFFVCPYLKLDLYTLFHHNSLMNQFIFLLIGGDYYERVVPLTGISSIYFGISLRHCYLHG